MITADIKIGNNLTPRLKSLQRELAKYPQAAEAKFISLTPIKTGNARKNTQLVNNKVIEASYPYAQPLDNGRSKQAPQGMTRPFSQWVANQARRIFGK